MPPEVSEDVKEKSGASSDAGNNLDKNQDEGGSGSDKAAGDKSEKDPRQIPYSRFKEVNDKAQKAQEVVDWYRENIGSPDDVVEFRKWKSEQLKDAERKNAQGRLSDEKLEAFRLILKQASPELFQLLEERRQDEQERMDSQFDDAEMQIRDLMKKNGFEEKESTITRVAVHVMAEIKNNPQLMRMWRHGNLRCVDMGFKSYMDEFVTPLRGSAAKQKSDLADRRRIKSLPTLPSGGSAGTSRAPERKPDDRGINKKTHEDAWDRVQEILSEHS